MKRIIVLSLSKATTGPEEGTVMDTVTTVRVKGVLGLKPTLDHTELKVTPYLAEPNATGNNTIGMCTARGFFNHLGQQRKDLGSPVLGNLHNVETG